MGGGGFRRVQGGEKVQRVQGFSRSRVLGGGFMEVGRLSRCRRFRVFKKFKMFRIFRGLDSSVGSSSFSCRMWSGHWTVDRHD